MNNNNADLVQATEAFLMADQRYIGLIRKAVEQRNGQQVRLTARDLRNIAQARTEKEELETQMYAVWSRYSVP